MFERLLLTLFLTLFGVAVFVAFRYLHMRWVSRKLPAIPITTDKPRLLYFRSDTCAPCATQAHYLRTLEQEFNGRVAIQKIDADIESDMADSYGVFTLPTTLIVDRGGDVKYINYGLTGATKLAQQLEKVV